MIKKLKKFLNIFNFCNTKTKEKIPDTYNSEEKIIRSIFSPINVSKNKKNLKSNAFKPPDGSDEISVIRLNYTTANFCKQYSKTIQNPQFNRNYFGLALLYVKEIIDCDLRLIFTPKPDNVYHSDIKIDYTCRRGEQLPAEIQYKIDKLTKKARLFSDPKPDSEFWEGGDLN